MTTESLKLEKDLCRCCHAEGSFHHLGEPCDNLGQRELYSEMLKSSLNIEVIPVAGLLCTMTFTICEACILRLRDADNFKKQVLLCEERFKEMYKNFTNGLNQSDVKPDIRVIKEEFPQSDDDAFDLRFDNDTDEDDKPVLQMKLEDEKKAKIKTKTKQKPKAKKSPVKKSTKKRPAKTAEEEPDGETGEEPKTKRGAKRYGQFVLKETDYNKDGDSFRCSHCGKEYYKFVSLRFHVKTKHYKIPRFICAHCKKEFMTPAPLTVHKLEEHNIDDRFKCKACNAAFNTKVQLRKHINNFHMLGEKYKCEFCEYESFSFEGMYKHKYKHKTVKDYHCRFCKKSFLRKATLDLHERIHTGDRRKVCRICGQAFVQKASLNYHMTKYHPAENF